MVGTFFWVMIIPYMSYARTKQYQLLRKQRRLKKAFVGFTYFVQLILSYWAMLLTMTYAIWLFLAVVCGLVVGHMYLYEDADEGKFMEDPTCCNVDQSKKSSGKDGESATQDAEGLTTHLV